MQQHGRVRPTRLRLAATAFAAALAVGLTACSGPAVTVRATRAEVARPVVAPPVHGRFDYQLGGAYPPAPGTAIVDRDRHDTAAKGVYGVCYLNAFQTQPDEATFWRRHPSLVLQRNGRPVTDPDWPGERILDITTAGKRAAIARIEEPWIDGCRQHGFRAVEPDNLDTFTRFHAITEADAVAFARLLVRRAHADGLAIAQKNTPELGRSGRRAIGFDFAVAEECQAYGECDAYTAVYGGHVIEIEYTDGPASAFPAACAARGARISVLLRDRDVVPRGDPAYRSRLCPGA